MHCRSFWWQMIAPADYRLCGTVDISSTSASIKVWYSHQLESSQSPHTSAKAMLCARWQHHLRFCSGFPYAPLKAMVTKISKWSRIQDSFRITPKIKSLVFCAIPDIPSKFQKDPSITFWVILLTHRETNRQRSLAFNITSLAEVTITRSSVTLTNAIAVRWLRQTRLEDADQWSIFGRSI